MFCAKIKKVKIIKAFIFLIFIFFTFYTTHKIKREIINQGKIREDLKKEAHDFKLKDIEGKEVSLKEMKGTGVVLIFFATWCGPCKKELETIKEEQFILNNYNAKLFLISDEDAEIVRKYLDVNQFDFKVLIDKDREIFKKYNVKAIPKTVIINDKGFIIFSKAGAIKSIYELLPNLPYKRVVSNFERRLYRKVDKILDSIPCSCNCGEAILKCQCKDCLLNKEKVKIRYYAGKLIEKEEFKEEQVAQILRWKYIENKKEKK